MAIIAAILYAPVMWWRSSHAAEDRDYAATLFAGRLPVDEVLASRRWNRALIWDCTFAVVRLDNDAPHIPATWRTDRRAFDFGGDWRRTPAPPLPQATRDAVASCANQIPPEVARELAVALAAPGGWFTREPPGEVVQVYAPGMRLAAKIRYGD
ncbi:MAG: hypothetical protein Q4G22_11290 [Paracoccus sp. (in: a-proteobacteria)]|uniref:hypothetical protein n=1 Tax=Paracoccus sp. TaxID=267 RepID=UPI0026DED57F|nr:hypothetical protein [Paracoccus sp. (in: a-proteobacteria)]MDO5632407.1 hypothetical protein [Paracoccus sp. (in: a-proteobacteria)]